MEETNRTLALLLVAAIVVSLGGTIVSLNKIGDLDIYSITGKAVNTSSGDVLLSVVSKTQITFTVNQIDFGSGYVNSSCTNCTMSTNSLTGSGSTDSVCCLTDWNTATNYGLWVENEGNTNLSVQLDSSDDASAFLGGGSVTPEFQWKLASDTDTSGCGGAGCSSDDTATSCTTGSWNYETWTDVNTTNPYVCGDAASYPFPADPSKNEFVIDARVVVPKDAPSGAKSATLTVTGTSA